MSISEAHRAHLDQQKQAQQMRDEVARKRRARQKAQTDAADRFVDRDTRMTAEELLAEQRQLKADFLGRNPHLGLAA